jgi:hypothetical protein
MRGRSSLLEGLTARVLRGQIEKESHEYLRIYLDWLRHSLTRSSGILDGRGDRWLVEETSARWRER